MARDTLAQAKAALAALLDGTVTGIDHTYSYEPSNGDRQGAVTLTVSTVGMTPTTWRYAIRLYIDGRLGDDDAQDKLDELIPAVDRKVTSDYGPGEWTVEWSDEIACWVATNVVDCIRNDY